MTAASAPKLYHQLNGVFAVYKHSGVSAALLGTAILEKLVSDLCSLEQRPQKQMIKYLPRKYADRGQLSLPNETTGFDRTITTMDTRTLSDRVPVNVTDWFDHPLVQGPRYNRENFDISVGHVLDQKASGIQMYGLQSRGRTMLRKMNHFRLTRSYNLHGRFGQASVKFDGEGRVIERSTWDHITETKISRLLCMIQGTYRNALMRSSNLDMESQYAYEMACKGLLRPQVPTGPMVLDLKLKELDLPDFVVDVTCINESCQFLRKLVHEIGLELRSSAVCLKLRRYRDSVFFAEDESTLLTRQITSQRVADIMEENHDKLSPYLAQKPYMFSEKYDGEDDAQDKDEAAN